MEGLAALLQATGMAGEPADLDEAGSGGAAGLGLEDVPQLKLASGEGAIRALLVRADDVPSPRAVVQRIAARLATRAPHVLWIVGCVFRDGHSAAIAAWTQRERRPQIAAFHWEPGSVLPSDAETLCALAALHAEGDVLLHARCVEVLGREALTRRFYRALEREVGALEASLPRPIAPEDGRAVALLYASRLLFLCFLEAKGWLDGDRAFIASRFDDCMRHGGRYHERVLLPLFFGTLNTPAGRRAPVARRLGRVPFLNGGLFTRTPAERRVGRIRFGDAELGTLLQEVFQRFRFVAREDSSDWSEASVDPEMLGRAFECLMAPAERRSSGAFYTPHALVARVAEHALGSLAPDDVGSLERIRSVRVLDPACGSGAFLVHVLERLADMRKSLGETASVARIRRDVLTTSVFGVDRDPTAVWLCELRLWLSVVIESDERDPLRVPPLPNLDRNIRVGDALLGADFSGGAEWQGGATIRRLRERYVRATGVRKQSLARQLDREERRRALAHAERAVDVAHRARREFLEEQRAPDLFGVRGAAKDDVGARARSRQLRDAVRSARAELRRLADGGALPFSFPACFADAHAAGGFHVVLGNPPWVRLHRIPGSLRAQFKQRFEVFRAASWQAGAADANAARGFASQVDLAALFAERSVSLLRSGGAVSLLLPAKLWRSLSAGGLRRFLLERTALSRIEDLSESRHAFDAAVYPSLVVARRDSPATRPLDLAVHDRDGSRRWTAPVTALSYDGSAGSPWILLPRDARAAFDLLRQRGIPLARTGFGAPRLGVKSGCNAAFIVRLVDAAREIATVVDSGGEQGKVELAMLRPALRGEGVGRWQRGPCDDWIIWTHDERGPMPRLPDRARAWLRRHYGPLTARVDAARSRRWWTLFRVDAADVSASRVVWADFGRRPRALVLEPGDPVVPLNTCYVLRCSEPREAWALAALLNCRLAAAWLNALAEPARGGYRRYLGWTVGRLPLPRDWERARGILSRAARLAQQSSHPGDDTGESLLEPVLDAYGIERRDVSALLDWP